MKNGMIPVLLLILLATMLLLSACKPHNPDQDESNQKIDRETSIEAAVPNNEPDNQAEGTENKTEVSNNEDEILIEAANTIGNTNINAQYFGTLARQTPYTFFSQKGRIYRVTDDNRQPAIIVEDSGNEYIRTVYLNVLGDSLYYSLNGSIVKSSLDGKNKTTLATDINADDLIVTNKLMAYVNFTKVDGIKKRQLFVKDSDQKEFNPILKDDRYVVALIAANDSRLYFLTTTDEYSEDYRLHVYDIGSNKAEDLTIPVTGSRLVQAWNDSVTFIEEDNSAINAYAPVYGELIEQWVTERDMQENPNTIDNIYLDSEKAYIVKREGRTASIFSYSLFEGKMSKVASLPVEEENLLGPYVKVAANKLYFSYIPERKICRANMDGSEIEVFDQEKLQFVPIE